MDENEHFYNFSKIFIVENLAMNKNAKKKASL